MERDINCSIRCNRLARERIWRLPEARDATYCRASSFACVDCHQTWDWKDFSGYENVATITCSNCYGDRVIITRVHVEKPEERK